jgi:hypothetical protein
MTRYVGHNVDAVHTCVCTNMWGCRDVADVTGEG